MEYGAFWTGALLLDQLGEKKAAARLLSTIEAVVVDKANHCPDLGGQATTRKVTMAVIAALQIPPTIPQANLMTSSRNLLQNRGLRLLVAAANPLRLATPLTDQKGELKKFRGCVAVRLPIRSRHVESGGGPASIQSTVKVEQARLSDLRSADAKLI